MFDLYFLDESYLGDAVQKFLEVNLSIVVLIALANDLIDHFTFQTGIYVFIAENIRVRADFSSAGETLPFPSASSILNTVIRFYCLKMREFSIEHATNSV